MGLFDKKDSVSRQEMRSALRRSSIIKPGTGGGKYTEKERMTIEKELFPSEYGGQISKKDYNDALSSIERGKAGKSFGERREIQRKIDALKKFGGK